MQVPDELMKKWKALRTHGDGRKIADRNQGITEMDISRAFNQGDCRDEVFNAIAGFYKEKELKVKEYM